MKKDNKSTLFLDSKIERIEAKHVNHSNFEVNDMFFNKTPQSLSNQELINFFEVIENFVATMPKSGLEEGVRAIMEDEKKESYTYRICASIIRDIENGHLFSEALAKFPQSFPPFVVGIIRMSEQTGQLDKSIKEIMFRQKLQENISATVAKATFIPKISAFVCGLLFFFTCLFVIPKLGDTFGALDTDLPLFTKVVMMVGNFMADFWFIWLAIIVVIMFAYIWLKKNRPEKLALLRLQIPFWKPIESNQIKYDFCSIMGICIDAGVEPVQALNYTALATDNIFLKELIRQSKRLTNNGMPFDEALKQEDHVPILDNKLYRILLAGRTTGKTGYNMKKQSEYYRTKLMMATDAIGDKVGMVVVTIIICAVAILLTAISLPIINFGSTLVTKF